MIINNERSLAYIVKIAELRDLPGYDKVCHARAENQSWWVIVRKDEIHIGDLVVYFEIDSLLPKEDTRFLFMEGRNYRVKTLRMCKVYSQGLFMPLSEFPELKSYSIGEDVSKKLGITYYVEADNARKASNADSIKYMSMSARHKNVSKTKLYKWFMKRAWGRKFLFLILGKKKDSPKGWPNKFPFIHKTDEERCENIPEVLNIKDPLIVTEKLDGTSSTYILERKGRNKFEFYVLSRNVRQKDEKQSCYHDHNIYWDMAFKYNIENNLKTYLKSFPNLSYVCIQGESVGSVQGNPLKLKADDLYVFNFIKSDLGRLNSVYGKEIIKTMGMKWVPILDTDYHMPSSMEEFKKFATSKSVVNPQVMREGIVLRNPKNDFSFKNVSIEYLLKHNEG